MKFGMVQFSYLELDNSTCTAVATISRAKLPAEHAERTQLTGLVALEATRQFIVSAIEEIKSGKLTEVK